MQIRKITVPRSPAPIQVPLGKNGKLLPDDEINRIKSIIKDEGKYTRSKLGSKFPFVFSKGKYYILCTHDYCSEGGYGKVIPAQDADTGEFVAFKIITTFKNEVLRKLGFSNSESDSQYSLAVEHEAEFLASVGQAITDSKGKPIKLALTSEKHEGRIKYMIVMKWFSGKSLHQCKLEKFPFIVTLRTIEQILREVKRTHELGILHRDLKDGNFMFDYTSHKVTLIDFGLARCMDQHKSYSTKSTAGTSGYIAPEIYNLFNFDNGLKKSKRYELLLKLKNDLLALENPTKESIRRLISDGGIYNEKTEIYALGKTLKSIRPGDNQYVTAENRKKYETQYEKMKNKDPEQRPSIDACIQFFQDMQNELTDKEKLFRVGIIDIRYFDRLRKMYNADFNLYIRLTIIHELENYHKIIFLDGSCNVDNDLYANVMEDVGGCGLYHVSNDVYLAPLSYQLINEIYDDLSRQFPLYLTKLYSVNLDKTIELKPNKDYAANLTQKFGMFLPLQGMPVDDDNVYSNVLC